MEVEVFQTNTVANSPLTCEINFPKLLQKESVNVIDVNCHLWALIIGNKTGGNFGGYPKLRNASNTFKDTF